MWCRTALAGFCFGMLSCSSTVQSGEAVQQPSVTTMPVVSSSTGEFYDLFDVTPEVRPYVGFLMWSGVPLEDAKGMLHPSESLSQGVFWLWALSAANEPLHAETISAQKPLTQSAWETAKANGWALGVVGEKVTAAVASKQLQSLLRGRFRESVISTGSEVLTRADLCRILVQLLQPAVDASFLPERAEASLLLPTRQFWNSVWDARIAEARMKPVAKRSVASGRHRGVTIESLKPPEEGRYGSAAYEKSLSYMSGLGVDSIAVIPYARLLRYDIPSIIYGTGAGYSDDSVERAIRGAKAKGYRVLLKPHLWLANRMENKGQWTGSTRFDTAGWEEWLSRYRAMVLGYAVLAERAGADILILGTELKSATKAYPEYFETLIEECRLLFGGELSYAANHDEFQRIGFWSKLDYVGVDAYFALSDERSPTVSQLVEAWKGAKEELLLASRASGKKVLFLEAGYKPKPYALKAPWEWQSGEETLPEVQEAGYRALFDTFWGEEWFAGVYFWKYFSDIESSAHEVKAEQFHPKGLPAEGVLKDFFQKKTFP